MQVINTNIGSLNAQRALSTTQEAQQTAMERLSSGSRINRAKDDASGLSLRESANFLRIGFIYLKKT
jgi:flagellin